MQSEQKISLGITLTNSLVERIDSVKSKQISRSAFIGIAVEEYLEKHYPRENKVCLY